MIHKIIPDFYQYVEILSPADKVGTPNNIYGKLASTLVEIFDMNIAFNIRIHLEELIDESSKDGDWITRIRMI